MGHLNVHAPVTCTLRRCFFWFQLWGVMWVGARVFCSLARVTQVQVPSVLL